jgi:cytochrome c5
MEPDERRVVVRHGHLQRLKAGVPLLALVACSSASPAPSSTGVPYLTDASYRRSELVKSLVNPADGYAQLRLAHYATGDTGDWDRLPEWNPDVDVIGASELDAPGGAQTATMSASAAPLALPADVTSEDDPRLVALGEAAFHRYPMGISQFLDVALASRSAAAHYGVWVDDVAGAGGLVRARVADGSGALGATCATCHEAPVGGRLVPGRPNALFDIGAARIDGAPGPMPTALEQALEAWGPGRVDVTTNTGLEPVRIADLRPVAWLPYLQADATVHQVDRTSLAIRIETLLITSAGESVRPPRVVPLALAAYIASLAPSLPDESAAAAASPRGAELFAQTCAGCHEEPGLTGAPVPIGVMGTDPTIGDSQDRGTGMYRVPSLHGVATRGPLLHDGTVPTLDAMFDPARVTAPYAPRLHGVGAIPGHPFGLNLGEADRDALVAFLKAL